MRGQQGVPRHRPPMRKIPAMARPRGRRNALLFAAILGLAALAVPPPSRPVIVYNSSASLPLGFYEARPVGQPVRGELVLVRLPGSVREFAAMRHYLPANVPLMKPIAALAGDFVCVESNHVTINGKAIAGLLNTDYSGRGLIPWSECRRLIDGEFFLMSSVESSFDSRYFGPIHISDLQARLVPLWTW